MLIFAIVFRFGLGESKKRREPVEGMSLAEVQNRMAKANPQPAPTNLQHIAQGRRQTSGSVVPELAHLTSSGQSHKRQRNFSRKLILEPEEEPHFPTPLLANRKLHGRWRAARSSQHHPDTPDSDDDVPVGQYVPRSHKLVMTPSRNHLQVVPKSPMSPLNGCDTAPANQRRRTPTPFGIPTVDGLESGVEDIACKQPVHCSRARLT